MARKPRSRKAMIEYLENHFRYNTMNSWNRSTSYAADVKLHTFVPNDIYDEAYGFLETDDAFRGGRLIIRQFDIRHRYGWQIGSNGRSGGYLVLYRGGTKPSGYKRICDVCGQQNYRRGIPQEVLDDKSPEGIAYLYVLTHTMWVPAVYLTQPDIAELGLPDEKVLDIVRRAKEDVKKNGDVGVNKCGRCGREGTLLDYGKTHMQVFTMPGQGVDDDSEDFESWETYSLKDRVDIVWDFDKTVEKVKAAFIDFVRSHKMVEEEILVPKTIHVAVPKGD